MIIDCHCHAGKGDGLSGPWDTAAPLTQYLRWASSAGIDRTVLFAAFHSNYAAANREVARIVAARPERFFGFAFVHPERDRGRVAEMIGVAVGSYEFVGIKVHRHDARITREICEVARGYALPVLYDVMGEVAMVELLATEYPEVNFIIPHLGSFADDWRAQTAFIPLLERYANVFTDTSGVRRFELLARAVRRAGPGKVLFGSDGPWLHPGIELAKVRALGLSRGDEERVLSGNFLRLTREVRRMGWRVRKAGRLGAGGDGPLAGARSYGALAAGAPGYGPLAGARSYEPLAGARSYEPLAGARSYEEVREDPWLTTGRAEQ